MFSSVQETWTPPSPIMANPKKLGPTAPHAIRLRAVQEWLKIEQNNAFAVRLGVSPTRLANVYGGMPLSRDLAFLVDAKIVGGLSHWLWIGDYGVLPVRMAEELRAAEAVVLARMEGRLEKRRVKKSRKKK